MLKVIKWTITIAAAIYTAWFGYNLGRSIYDDRKLITK